MLLSATLERTLYASFDALGAPPGSDLAEFVFGSCAIRLAGLAGESAALGKCRSGTAGDDLMWALVDARKLTTVRGWSNPVSAAIRSPSAARRLDIGSMYSRRPPLDLCRCLDAAYIHARQAVETHRAAFDRLRFGLLERGSLDGRQMAWLVCQGSLPP
jgi:hypothetical protein